MNSIQIDDVVYDRKGNRGVVESIRNGGKDMFPELVVTVYWDEIGGVIDRRKFNENDLECISEAARIWREKDA